MSQLRRRVPSDQPDENERSPLITPSPRNETASAGPSTTTGPVIRRQAEPDDAPGCCGLLGAFFSSSMNRVWGANTPAVASPEARHRAQAYHNAGIVPYEPSNAVHERLLFELYRVCTGETLTERISASWKQLGFQGTDPATDFRGAGVYGLINMLYLARYYPNALPQLVNGTGGEHYPFAIACLNINMLIWDLLGYSFKRTPPPPSLVNLPLLLCDPSLIPDVTSAADSSARTPLEVAANTQRPFDEAFVLGVLLMDRNWRRMNATYMNFPDVLAATRTELIGLLERAHTLEDLQQLIRSVNM